MTNSENINALEIGEEKTEVRRGPGRPKTEKSHDDFPVKSDRIVMPGESDNYTALQGADDASLDKYIRDIAFNEEPVKFRINSNGYTGGPPLVYCAIQGKPPEILVNGKWFRLPSFWIECNRVYTMRRKYVEVLMRSVETTIEMRQVKDADNNVANVHHRAEGRRISLSIIHDPSPASNEWQARIYWEALL